MTEGVAAQVLMNLGLTLEKVREEVLNALGRKPKDEPESAKLPAPAPASMDDIGGWDQASWSAMVATIGPAVSQAPGYRFRTSQFEMEFQTHDELMEFYSSGAWCQSDVPVVQPAEPTKEDRP